jgi:hypothetical protein
MSSPPLLESALVIGIKGSFGLAGAWRVDPHSKFVTIDCVAPQGDLTWLGAAGSVRAPEPEFGVFRGPRRGGCCHDAPAMLHFYID